jgi:hypothetical protein
VYDTCVFLVKILTIPDVLTLFVASLFSRCAVAVFRIDAAAASLPASSRDAFSMSEETSST